MKPEPFEDYHGEYVELYNENLYLGEIQKALRGSIYEKDAKKMIHWQPRTSLFNGLKETWGWFVKNQVEYKKKQNYFKN